MARDWTQEALILLDGLIAARTKMDRMQYALERRLGWRPSAAEIKAASARTSDLPASAVVMRKRPRSKLPQHHPVPAEGYRMRLDDGP